MSFITGCLTLTLLIVLFIVVMIFLMLDKFYSVCLKDDKIKLLKKRVFAMEKRMNSVVGTQETEKRIDDLIKQVELFASREEKRDKELRDILLQNEKTNTDLIELINQVDEIKNILKRDDEVDEISCVLNEVNVTEHNREFLLRKIDYQYEYDSD